jgi:hypothetical protein
MASGQIKLKENTGVYYAGFEAPESGSADVLFKLPAADGAPGQVLATDGSKALSFVNQSDVASEATARLAADSTLQNNVSSEASSRLAADSTLTSNLNAEITSRLNADSTLTSNLNTETTARLNADSTLTSNLQAIGTIIYYNDIILAFPIGVTTITSQVTLTVGTWLVHGFVNKLWQSNGDLTSFQYDWKIKGTMGGVASYDKVVGSIPIGIGSNTTMPTRVVTIAAGDSDRTIQLMAWLSYTGTPIATLESYILAVKLK